MKDAKSRTGTGRGDPIVAELHARRERHAREFDYDPAALFEDWQRRQEASDREVVSFPPQRISQAREGSTVQLHR